MSTISTRQLLRPIPASSNTAHTSPSGSPTASSIWKRPTVGDTCGANRMREGSLFQGVPSRSWPSCRRFYQPVHLSRLAQSRTSSSLRQTRLGMTLCSFLRSTTMSLQMMITTMTDTWISTTAVAKAQTLSSPGPPLTPGFGEGKPFYRSSPKVSTTLTTIFPSTLNSLQWVASIPCQSRTPPIATSTRNPELIALQEQDGMLQSRKSIPCMQVPWLFQVPLFRQLCNKEPRGLCRLQIIAGPHPLPMGRSPLSLLQGSIPCTRYQKRPSARRMRIQMMSIHRRSSSPLRDQTSRTTKCLIYSLPRTRRSITEKRSLHTSPARRNTGISLRSCRCQTSRSPRPSYSR
jgi:hypothetical protein